MPDSFPALVIGAGISGLVCAYSLRRAGIDAHLLEASPRVGGLIESIRDGEFLIELGPQSFSATGLLRQLCRDLGIEKQLVAAPARAPRLVLLDGALKQVPLNPVAFLASSFVGGATKWSILRDILGRSMPPAEEESVAAFVRRKFSAELLERLVGPFVSGIYAGDPEKLSLRASFPQLYEAEVAAGSVVRGAMHVAKQNRQSSQSRAPQGFRDGNETLPRAIGAWLGQALHQGARVTSVRASCEAARFTVKAVGEGTEREFATQSLILAVPTDIAATLLACVSPESASTLDRIEYAPVAVVSLGYRRADVGHNLDGFGFLVPRSAGLQVLGCVWNSSLFPGRAPAGHVLMTSFVGGITNPGATRMDTAHLEALVHREVAPILRISALPVFSRVQVCERAIPQYNLGHPARIAALEKARASLPGLFFVGNYLRGPSVGACAEQAQITAAKVINRLKS